MERTAGAEQQKNSSLMAPRLACLVVPLFPLAARLRSEPALKDEAVVLCEGNGTAAHVVAATRKARKAGIRPGFTLPQARALVPDLLARARDTVPATSSSASCAARSLSVSRARARRSGTSARA